MSYNILKGKYLGHDSKSFEIQILENNKVVKTLTVYGSRQKAKEIAAKTVKEMSK